jgi:hypothetical protein
MAIREVSGTEQTRGSVSIREIEISEEGFYVRTAAVMPPVFTSAGWEFTCGACDAYSTGLTEDEARAELDEHECPDVPPCERDEPGESIVPRGYFFGGRQP